MCEDRTPTVSDIPFPDGSVPDIESREALQGNTMRTFSGVLYWIDPDDRVKHCITRFSVTAEDAARAESRILDLYWDHRLDSTDCVPHFEWD